MICVAPEIAAARRRFGHAAPICRLPANAHRVKPHHEPRHPCGRPLIR
ncbi:Uncharacterised protein [Burkholderia pseudomallei]|nr:Uncharacterised protein [Burkholderia pseudomallei]VCN31576.1 Uncharacterised protein [Burkholderia pseudomallei]VCN36358.1 Uncharacterised protein [Burkholderia pseudomallei]VCN45030.1 Uncharacterised protein [Burkholderia pseudomallei]VCN45594.1 Uncharacterised protein [Burkholderia pseudomallei]